MLDVEDRPAHGARLGHPVEPGVAADGSLERGTQSGFAHPSTRRLAGPGAAVDASGHRQELHGVTDVDSKRPRRRQAPRRRGRFESTSVTPYAPISSFPLRRRVDRHSSSSDDRSCDGVHQVPQTDPPSLRPNGSPRPTSDEARPRDVLRTSNDRGSPAKTRLRSGRRPTTVPAASAGASAC